MTCVDATSGKVSALHVGANDIRTRYGRYSRMSAEDSRLPATSITVSAPDGSPDPVSPAESYPMKANPNGAIWTTADGTASCASPPSSERFRSSCTATGPVSAKVITTAAQASTSSSVSIAVDLGCTATWAAVGSMPMPTVMGYSSGVKSAAVRMARRSSRLRHPPTNAAAAAPPSTASCSASPAYHSPAASSGETMAAVTESAVTAIAPTAKPAHRGSASRLGRENGARPACASHTTPTTQPPSTATASPPQSGSDTRLTHAPRRHSLAASRHTLPSAAVPSASPSTPKRWACLGSIKDDQKGVGSGQLTNHLGAAPV
mmetsp:Transcript_5646/g.17016  ORF Transcript_5646/g.17016 Transcript_5646/m.17016 type:complete len:319 (+) Transcript_5646:214-1170(+)